MIQANELRLGNWLKRNSQPNGFLVDVQTIVRLVHSGVRDEHPIPLTPEILEKCGFENDNVFKKMFKYLNKSIYDTDKLTFRKEEGFICFDGIKYRTLLKHVIYLHQLQNLYFALTGEELTVNL